MTPQSAKAKGRALQKWVVSKILHLFPILGKEDVLSRSMGAGGEDVHLSPAARTFFPYSVECKARKSLKTLYDWFAQAQTNANGNTPMLIVKGNHKDPLAIVEADHFFALIKELKNVRTVDA